MIRKAFANGSLVNKKFSETPQDGAVRRILDTIPQFL